MHSLLLVPSLCSSGRGRSFGWAVLSPPDSHAASLALTVEIADNYSRHRRNCVQSSLGPPRAQAAQGSNCLGSSCICSMQAGGRGREREMTEWRVKMRGWTDRPTEGNPFCGGGQTTRGPIRGQKRCNKAIFTAPAALACLRVALCVLGRAANLLKCIRTEKGARIVHYPLRAPSLVPSLPPPALSALPCG